ncbi:hypothetical protein [Ktedonobacter racemifer]|uniref:Uncharacterized protein n=1 Tax=Ktedonobacter racemifer DSM 44963 TaxID=485913 RepID=D6U855_KTERA|nr:hypothetical protein [Ktedonobacter racemifer]EFH80066.1 conserved hypothetical protein [Ktedonobacter racemifer DSM 44963]
MNDLLAQVIAAHGGLDRWNTYKKVTATVVAGGGLIPLKGLDDSPIPRERTVSLHEEMSYISPFGQPDWHMVFTPERVVIENATGEIVSERSNPRAAFKGHVLETVWDSLHRAYFNGYAIWTYLTTPFFMTMPGFEVTEITPWQEDGETWRGLRVRFPDAFASHSKEQDFYFGDDFLLRRHDYHLEIAGGTPVAQYVYDSVEADGIRFPTKRRAYVCGPQMKPIHDLLLISLDLSNFRFIRK